MGIPKHIWQTWKTRQVPERWRASPTAIRRYCPDWTYTLMTDSDNDAFVHRHFPQFLSLFRSFDREICRADMVRYLLLYKYGGVYMDLDMALTQPIDHAMRQGSLILVETPNWSGVTNALMASEAGHPFWLDVVYEIQYRVNHKPWYIIGDWAVLWTTGPGMLSSVVDKTRHLYTVMPSKIGHPCTICDHYFERPCGTDESLVRELEGSSWASAGWIHFLLCRWKLIVLIILLLIVFVFVLI